MLFLTDFAVCQDQQLLQPLQAAVLQCFSTSLWLKCFQSSQPKYLFKFIPM